MDEEAIRSLVARYAETWNAHDMESWGRLFTSDVDYVNRGGGWWRSNEENVSGHEAIHQRLARSGTVMDMALTVESIDFLARDIALVHVRSRWPGLEARAADAPAGGAMITMVLVERDGAWRIRAFHNTLVSSPT